MILPFKKTTSECLVFRCPTNKGKTSDLVNQAYTFYMKFTSYVPILVQFYFFCKCYLGFDMFLNKLIGLLLIF